MNGAVGSERIVAPLDGSEAAEWALPVAVDLAHRFGASLHVVRVIDLAVLLGSIQPMTSGDRARELAGKGSHGRRVP